MRMLGAACIVVASLALCSGWLPSPPRARGATTACYAKKKFFGTPGARSAKDAQVLAMIEELSLIHI